MIFFTNEAASHQHVTTDAQVDTLLKHGDAEDIPDVTFQCAVVNGTAYNRAIPLPPGAPRPLFSAPGVR